MYATIILINYVFLNEGTEKLVESSDYIYIYTHIFRHTCTCICKINNCFLFYWPTLN